MGKPKDPNLQNYSGRCRNCYMHEKLCICDLIPEIDNQNYLTLIMHQRETYKTTNTGRLACMALNNSQILVRGKIHKPIEPTELNLLNPEIHQKLILTLHEDAKVLDAKLLESLQKPIHLIVPDGNWRQANKMAKREPALRDILKIKLSPGEKSSYLLRREHHPEGLSTLEAIARAFAVIESPKIAEELLGFFNVMVERTMSTRGYRREP